MPEVQSPKQFLEDFIECAKNAHKRIYMQSMIFERGDILDKLEPILFKKAEEGVKIHITFDWISNRYVHDDLGLLPVIKPHQRKYNKRVRQETRTLIQRWSEKGITFTITNKPHPLASPITIFRRNHTKLFIIDESAVWIGGINLFDIAYTWIDFMVKFTEKSLIDIAYQHFTMVNNQRPKKNYSGMPDPQTTFYADAGLVGNSIIYNNALNIVQHAKHSIIFASQFLPDDVMLKKLIQASEQGVSVTVITSNKDYKGFEKFPYKIPYRYNLAQIKKSNITLLHKHTKVHAKLLLIDDQIAMFGSHNFVHLGVILGTEEVAIKTENPVLIIQLKRFIETYSAI